jgi:hypothetical protein
VDPLKATVSHTTRANPYSLAPLDLGSENIRLVQLLPDSDLQTIKCRLQSYGSVFSCPKYIALSYKWDHVSSKDTIELNGIPFAVGHSLWTFLNRMCLRENFDFFWLDAICIDQSDIQERNHQVQIMHTIYSSSEVVYIWLGESQSDSELLRAITCVKNWHKLRLILRADSFRIELLCHLMQSLCHHEYWGRMWIIQEVFYAKRAIIYYGSSDIDISVLDELVAEACGVHNHDPFNGIVGSFLTTPAAKILELRRSGQPASLFDLLLMFRNHETTEIRDKVYALHGMCEQA